MQNIRNIAIIAHVDHGKTTLVDKMLMAGNLFRDNQASKNQILDNNYNINIKNSNLLEINSIEELFNYVLSKQ